MESFSQEKKNTNIFFIEGLSTLISLEIVDGTKLYLIMFNNAIQLNSIGGCAIVCINSLENLRKRNSG